MTRVLSRRCPDVLAPPNATKSLRYTRAPAPCHPQLIYVNQIGRCE
jgi:hypothetical protein